MTLVIPAKSLPVLDTGPESRGGWVPSLGQALSLERPYDNIGPRTGQQRIPC